VKAAPFAYSRPARLEEVLELLAEPDAKALAGGQSLVPMMAMRLARPAHVIDLGGLAELAGVEDQDGHVRIGAMVTQRSLELDPQVRRRLPLLAAALPFVGHREIRNRGTLGGSLAHADPAAELPLVAATLEGEIEARGPGGVRSIAAGELVLGPFQTALDEGELLTAVRLPAARAGEGFAFAEVARRHGDFALCGVAVALRMRGGAVASARVGLLGVGPRPHVHDVAELLAEAAGSWEERARYAAQALAERMSPSSDMHASASYRRRLARALIARCLERARQDAEQRTR
jgi:2-furoyl-CoA dehydrogenase FAD binding subunit